jgi:hypothetical protein
MSNNSSWINNSNAVGWTSLEEEEDSEPSSLCFYYLILHEYMLSGETTNTCTNFIVFGFTWPELEPTIYSTLDKHYNIYEVWASAPQVLIKPGLILLP